MPPEDILRAILRPGRFDLPIDASRIEEVLDLALTHDVAEWVAHQFLTLFPAETGAISERCRNLLYANDLSRTRTLEVLRELSKQCPSAVTLLGGLSLMSQIPALRLPVIDILSSSVDGERISRALTRQGFRKKGRLVHRHGRGEAVRFCTQPLALEVRLHFSVPGFRADLDPATRPVVLPEMEVRGLSTEDLILYLSSRTVVASPRGGFLRPATELAWVLAQSAFDRELVLERARLHDLERHVRFAADLIERTFGIVTPFVAQGLRAAAFRRISHPRALLRTGSVSIEREYAEEFLVRRLLGLRPSQRPWKWLLSSTVGDA